MSFVGTLAEKSNVSIWIAKLDDGLGTPYVSATGFPNATSQRRLTSIETIHDHFGDGISINSTYNTVLDLPTGIYVFDVRMSTRPSSTATTYSTRLAARGLNIGVSFSTTSDLTRITRTSYPSYFEDQDSGGQEGLSFVYESVNDEGKVSIGMARSHSSGGGSTINYVDTSANTDSEDTGKARILIMRIE